MENFEAEKAELDRLPTKMDSNHLNMANTEETEGDAKNADRDVEEIRGEVEEEQNSLVSSLEVEIVFNHQLLILNIFNCSCFFEFNMLFSKLFYSNT